MSVTRIFTVTINAELREEFEVKFNSLSRSMLEDAQGCLKFDVLRPSKWAPDEYAMISEWQDVEALIVFVCEDWNSSVIPSEMKNMRKIIQYVTLKVGNKSN